MFIFYRKVRKITEFNKATEDWVSYVGKMTLFFKASRTEAEIEKKDNFAIECQSTDVRATLSVPRKMVDKTLQELSRTMTNRQDSKPNPLLERFKFNNQDWKLESIA